MERPYSVVGGSRARKAYMINIRHAVSQYYIHLSVVSSLRHAALLGCLLSHQNSPTTRKIAHARRTRQASQLHLISEGEECLFEASEIFLTLTAALPELPRVIQDEVVRGRRPRSRYTLYT